MASPTPASTITRVAVNPIDDSLRLNTVKIMFPVVITGSIVYLVGCLVTGFLFVRRARVDNNLAQRST
ncbi:hypothetical protein HK102_000896, partial [Quaeritorhiza haematococci]